ncbi:MAG: ATP synthase F1 subunit delta [Acidobacteriota bacterium]
MSRRIARPYAAALFSVMAKREPTTLRAVEGELATVAGLFARDEALLRVFEVPSVPPAKKVELLRQIGTVLGLRIETRRLLAALEQHVRLRFLGDVVAAFRDLVDRREGMVRGRVALPVSPTTEQMDELAVALSAALRARVELESEVKPELLAGFVVRLGSRVFDGSLKTQLRRFAATTARR